MEKDKLWEVPFQRNKRVYGVGINDANYNVRIYEIVGYSADGKQIRNFIWRCPFYIKWVDMLKRCYSPVFHEKNPTYIDCRLCDDWLTFSKFKSWMQAQDWEGKQLDKDLLVPGNKLYSPETCVFVDQKVNSFLTERQADRGEWPIGVAYYKDHEKYVARCCSVESGKQKTLGYYDNTEEAHKAWLTYKLEQAKILASQQTDERVAKALVARYENYNIN